MPSPRYAPWLLGVALLVAAGGCVATSPRVVRYGPGPVYYPHQARTRYQTYDGRYHRYDRSIDGWHYGRRNDHRHRGKRHQHHRWH
jgi:hypothetical protein